LAGVDLTIYPGQVHAVVGENGAGKSTLMKILAGAEQPDEGSVLVEDEPVSFRSTADATEHGVAIVFQELSLFPDIDVLANVFLLREPRRFGFIARKVMARRAREVFNEIGLTADLDRPVGGLPLDEQQLVEIARALLANANILVLDEPNSALNAQETARLFRVIRSLRERSVAVLYVSHRLEEVFSIADVITVMRNGAIVASVERSKTSMAQVLKWMIGREPSTTTQQQESRKRTGAPLRLEKVTVGTEVVDVSLVANQGEVVGLAGLEGAGVRAIYDVIFGIRAPDAGDVIFASGRTGPRSIAEAVRAGVAHVPADRRTDGLMLDQTVVANVHQVVVGTLRRNGFLLRRRMLLAKTKKLMEGFRITAPSPSVPVNHLSGGNQQKVVLAKWLETDPTVVLLDDPTRGVDVGSKEEIYSIVRRLADEGRVVLFTSSELLEYAYLCDRVIVLYQGRVCGELERHAIDEHRLLESINTGRV
jgi:ABC-type sugar transport system ATPase subunit